MADIWGSIKNTAESLGGAIVAPAGAVWDLASAPFDDEDDDFGTILNKLAGRAGDVLDPLLNEETFTGLGFSKAMQGLEYVYREGVSEPLSTGITQTAAAFDQRNPGVLFDAESWAKAYDVAQNRSIGQSMAVLNAEAPFMLGLNSGQWAVQGAMSDPMDDRAYRQINEGLGLQSTVLSGGMDFLARWYLDPGIVVGKGASAVKAKAQRRALSPEERVDLFDRMHTAKAEKLGLPVFGGKWTERTDISTRTENYLRWINEAGDGGRPLNAAEIFAGSPELARTTNGRAIAGLLADAGRLSEVPEEFGRRAVLEGQVKARNAQRRILAVAAGDESQIKRLESEIVDAGHIADQLKNMLRGTTLELKTQALVPSARTNPAFIADLERQLGNLNSEKAIDEFVTGWEARQRILSELAGGLKELPGTSATGRRALGREQGKGALIGDGTANTGNAALDTVVTKTAEVARKPGTVLRARQESASTIYAKGAYGIPLLVVNTVGLAASPWTKALPKGINALRTSQYHGIANLHDWDGSTIQLDSMMRVAQVDDANRMAVLSEAALARNEAERQRIIVKAENLSMKRLAERWSEKVGQEIDRGFIEELMMRQNGHRSARLTAAKGRAYAATQMDPAAGAALGTRVADSAVDQATAAASRTDSKWSLRVDQISDDGVPVALPLLETQLGNVVPMVDVNLAEKALSREGSRLSRMSRAWRENEYEIDRLSRMKAPAGSAVAKALEARRAATDMLLDVAATGTRVWKFSVLMRLGYPIRVVMDDHMRIWTQLNAMSFYGDNGTEAAKNLWYNKVTRNREASVAAAQMRFQRRELLDQAEAAGLAGYDDLYREARSLHRSINKKRYWVNQWEKDGSPESQAKLREAREWLAEKESARNNLLEQLPDESPSELRKRAGELEKQLADFEKAPKKTVGTQSFRLNGVEYDGAFATPSGEAMREASRSQATFDAVLQTGEEASYMGLTANRSHRIVQPGERGHLEAWASAVNFQFRQSEAAMHFVNGGNVDDFVKWLGKPQQKHLRERLPHFAHDPEDWGHRIQQLVDDYLPTAELREQVAKGQVTTATLRKTVGPDMGPAVHGAVVGDNLGISAAVTMAGKAMNRVMKALAETPTDRLSRHPYFNSMYKVHVQEQHQLLTLAKRKSGGPVRFTEADRQRVMAQARKMAMHDLKRTLFDISAHSSAAHVMRFVSPFFAAHQESLARWWRIVGDDPSIIRRFQQAFDMPRKLELVVNSEGELVESGEGISTDHRLLLQWPAAWGGKKIETFELEDGRKIVMDPTSISKWTLGENSFNLVLQGGLMNPGAGPVVSLPAEYLAAKYANEEEIARVARVFNPFPPGAPTDVLWPATLKRFMAAVQGEGNREYNTRWRQNISDMSTDFLLENGREPTESEAEELRVRAGRLTNTEMWLRFANNMFSPAPAQPGSKYAAITNAWRQISDLSRDKGYGYEWAIEKFKERYGEAYMPLIYSTFNNPTGIDISIEAVSAFKQHRPLLGKVDYRLHKGVMGADGKGEWSPEARVFFMNQRVRPGDSETYLSNDDPRTAQIEHQVKRGWDRYAGLTAQLDLVAQQAGLTTYRESEVLMQARREAVEQLKAENYAWGEEWDSFNPNEFDSLVDDLERVAFESKLGKDSMRGDVRVLQQYLATRAQVLEYMEARREAGLTFSPDAQDMAPVMEEFTRVVGQLVESNTEFDEYWFQGLLERDPLLTGEVG
ncbi:hypothetical protein [Nocardioides massiliensis]|uniref:Transcriptional regulator with XRE-family HTH domain n=1 Tax=Nocardioides massiliensis TaxID=1325935 RepID=A0ABT9NJ89_9ACTN|nr:hypothetical protein [Nocardioides massiliensis]MDP9820480.1 transcriptional regulator with XRE-family HTH domain [Nocardioides massiliensis]